MTYKSLYIYTAKKNEIQLEMCHHYKNEYTLFIPCCTADVKGPSYSILGVLVLTGPVYSVQS